jgi:hypothetical protein
MTRRSHCRLFADAINQKQDACRLTRRQIILRNKIQDIVSLPLPAWRWRQGLFSGSASGTASIENSVS